MDSLTVLFVVWFSSILTVKIFSVLKLRTVLWIQMTTVSDVTCNKVKKSLRQI